MGIVEHCDHRVSHSLFIISNPKVERITERGKRIHRSLEHGLPMCLEVI